MQFNTWWSIYALNYTFNFFPYSLTVAPASGHAYNQLALIEVSKGNLILDLELLRAALKTEIYLLNVHSMLRHF